MNQGLLVGSLEQTFPEVIEDSLEEGYAVTMAFNRRGSLLAVGCNDGRVVIWDFDTRGTSPASPDRPAEAPLPFCDLLLSGVSV